MKRMQKRIAMLGTLAALLVLSGVSLLASKGELHAQGGPKAQTEIVIRIDGFTAYRLPLF